MRVRKTALREYTLHVQLSLERPSSLSRIMYEFQVMRLARKELGQRRMSADDQEFARRLDREMKRLRDACLTEASKHLGLAIALTQVNYLWALSNRSILEAYRAANPKGVDVRPLLCQAYNSGIGYGPPIDAEGHAHPMIHHPDEPQPKVARDIARTMLKDDPNSGLGHFYVGISSLNLDDSRTASRERGLALATGRLPDVFAGAARAFVEHPGWPALRPHVPY